MGTLMEKWFGKRTVDMAVRPPPGGRWALEPRILFDGAGVASVDDIQSDPLSASSNAASDSVHNHHDPALQAAFADDGKPAPVPMEALRSNLNPIRFEENVGQATDRVDYLARGAGYGVAMNETELLFSLWGGPKVEQSGVEQLTMRWESGNIDIREPSLPGAGSSQLV